jgi:hypothetical protein
MPELEDANLDAIAAYINANSTYKAFNEHTGGGVMCVLVVVGDKDFYFGTANETWGGSYASDEDNSDINLETYIPSDCTDTETIAKAILESLKAQFETIPALAKEFATVMHEWATDAMLADIIAKNRTAEYFDKDCCASHDFFDANMTMLEACQRLGIKTALDFEGDTPEHEAACAVWNAAWTLAKDNEFDVKRITEAA